MRAFRWLILCCLYAWVSIFFGVCVCIYMGYGSDIWNVFWCDAMKMFSVTRRKYSFDWKKGCLLKQLKMSHIKNSIHHHHRCHTNEIYSRIHILNEDVSHMTTSNATIQFTVVMIRCLMWCGLMAPDNTIVGPCWRRQPNNVPSSIFDIHIIVYDNEYEPTDCGQTHNFIQINYFYGCLKENTQITYKLIDLFSAIVCVN